MLNVILGFYCGYNSIVTEKGGIKVFLESLRKVNKECIIVVLCKKTNLFNDLNEICKKNNSIIFFYDSFGIKINDCITDRNEIYLKILNIIEKKYNDSIDKVLLCDMNDVIFQNNPFSINFDENFYCALEQNMLDDLSNESSKLNLTWISQFYKTNINKVSELFKGNYVTCAGTILGKCESIKKFLIWYVEVRKINKYNDQGLWNIFVYKICQSKSILTFNVSDILTLDKINFDKLKKNEKGYIINDNGKEYSIIHQIDRCGKDNMNYLINMLT